MNKDYSVNIDQLADHAEGFRKKGIPVLPLYGPVSNDKCSCGKAECSSVGKHPRTYKGVKDATLSAGVFHFWLKQFGHHMNLGITTGGTFIVLDQDNKNNGHGTIAELQKQFGPLPNTVTSKTGNGRHYFFKVPDEFKKPNRIGILPGIDVKGDNGYVVAPPSRHRNGNLYGWETGKGIQELEIAPAPDWLLESLTKATMQSHNPKHWRQLLNYKIRDGERNDKLTRLLGHLLGKRVDAVVATELILAVNQSHCDPPISQSEVLSMSESIIRRHLENKHGKGY